MAGRVIVLGEQHGWLFWLLGCWQEIMVLKGRLNDTTRHAFNDGMNRVLATQELATCFRTFRKVGCCHAKEGWMLLHILFVVLSPL